MTVRSARAADAGAIAEIWNGYIGRTSVTFTAIEKSCDGIAADISARAPGGLFLVAEAGGAVLGFATAGCFREGPGYRHTLETSLYVVSQARRRGMGCALMNRLEAAARAGRVHVLVAAISGENTDAIAFHARMGFTEAGRMAQVGRKFGRWRDLVLMQKIL